MSNKCQLCGYIFDEGNLEESIEEHLREKHFMGYQEYYETVLLDTPWIECWKCGAPRYSLSPYMTSLHLPCSCCISEENKSELQGEIIKKVLEFQGLILRNKYYQYLLSLSSSERTCLLPKSFKTQADNLQILKKREKLRIDKSHLIWVTNILGTSGEISKRNLENLGMASEEMKVEKSGERYRLGDTGLYISLPESIPFDSRHHSRNSILNPASKRSAKRIRISETGECFKFFPTPNPSARSILQVSSEDGKVLSYPDLPEDTQWKIRFGVLKTKPILSRVLEIYNEIFKFLGWLEDSVFLLNSIELSGNLGMIFTWSWEDQTGENLGGEIIKLSVL